MTMDILLGLNIIVDLLIPERKGNPLARQINHLIKEKWIHKVDICLKYR